MPQTFSITTRHGWRTETAWAMCRHRPERVPSARPARRPARGQVLAGESRGEYADPGDLCPVRGGEVAEVGHAGPVPGQDAGGVGVVLGVPDDGAAEGGLDAEVQAAVAVAQAADP